MFNLKQESYDIEPELRARKILEKYTDYTYTFEKNEDIYGYDICMYRYNKDKIFIGYIEVEYCRNWETLELPSYWYELSFLERKIINQDNLSKTFYLKFNNNFTNCFCVKMLDLVNHGKYSVRNNKNSLIEKERNDRYIVLPLKSSFVKVGITGCINYIIT